MEPVASCLRKIQQELSCSICLSLVESPYATNCNHLFCKECLESSLKYSSICPLCKMKLTKRSVRSAIELEPILSSFLLLKSSYEQDYEELQERSQRRISVDESNCQGVTNLTQLFPYPEKAAHENDQKSKRKTKAKESIFVDVVVPSFRRDAEFSCSSDTNELTMPDRDISLLRTSTKESKRKLSKFSIRPHFLPPLNSLDPDPSNSSSPLDRSSDFEFSLTSHGNIRSLIKREKYFICYSHLTPVDLKQLDSFEGQFDNAAVLEDWDSKIVATHLICGTMDKKKACKRTMKYFKAMLSGCWILDIAWILTSLQKNCIVSPIPFEIRTDDVCSNIPTREERLKIQKKGLFYGLKFMLSDCIDEATLATSSLVGDLVYLIQIGKGSLVTVPDEGNPCTRSVIYLFATNPMALLHPGGNRVHYSWLLDCISGFKVLPFTGYLFLNS